MSFPNAPVISEKLDFSRDEFDFLMHTDATNVFIVNGKVLVPETLPEGTFSVSGEVETSDSSESRVYIIQAGDTLWDIAQKHKGLSVSKIKALNNLESDYLKPGT